MTAPVAATFDLADQNGARVTAESYRGRFLLVFFGFTHCRVVCPRALRRLSLVLERLGGLAARIQPLYISVDPERDTPERMKTFLAEYHPAIRGLTGSAAATDAAKRAFRVFAERRPDAAEPDGYVVPHTAITYLIDPAGAYCAHFTDSIDEATLEARLRALVER